MKTLIKNVVHGFGYDLKRVGVYHEDYTPDFTEEEVALYQQVKPYTMTSISSVVSIVHSIKYIVENNIEGDIVECGVWRGGSVMAVALFLKSIGETNRRFYLYDTFTGMTEPTEKDRQFDGKLAKQVWQESTNGAWCHASLEDVKNNMASTGYPADKIHYIEGMVEETIPNTLPEKISLLRLDTDWYDSTKHELEHLYPLLAPHGILIIDDYGHWSGSKTATDEFISRQKIKPFLNRVDYSRRLIIKPAGL